MVASDLGSAEGVYSRLAGKIGQWTNPKTGKPTLYAQLDNIALADGASGGGVIGWMNSLKQIARANGLSEIYFEANGVTNAGLERIFGGRYGLQRGGGFGKWSGIIKVD
jgi:hypothetical protein